jgi:small redox-active disulfide protein 2
MRIQVLGPGCSRCRELTKRTESAAQNLGLDVAVEKVSDLGEIMKFGIMMTPALVIDGTVKIAGRVPSEGEIQAILKTVRGQIGGPK